MKKSSMSKRTTSSRNSFKLFPVACLLAVVIAFAIGIYFLCNAYLYSGCTTEIDENANYEYLLLNYISHDPYKTPEPYRINSVQPEFIMDPEPATYYKVYANFSTDPFEAVVYTSPKPPMVTAENTKFVEFSERQKNMIESAKNLVIQYINTSEILRDKEMLIQEIENIPFNLYTESSLKELNEPWVPAQHLGYGIYCNKEYSEFFSESIFVHELIHHISYVTNEGNFGEYCGFMLDETITEIITSHINPKTNPEIEVDYVYYMPTVYSYLTIFGRDAIEAYFYGYDDFFQKHGGKTFKFEHDAFVAILSASSYYYYAYELTEAFLGTWHARLYEN